MCCALHAGEVRSCVGPLCQCAQTALASHFISLAGAHRNSRAASAALRQLWPPCCFFWPCVGKSGVLGVSAMPRRWADSGRGAQYMTEAEWNPRMMKTIFTELHLYDEDENYAPFDYKKEEPFWAFQRRVLPSTM